MKHRALVVDDDEEIRSVVADILGSLGHEHDVAGTQEEARARLRKGPYSYVLLDLEIPVKAGGLPRIQNGINLLWEIRRAPGMADRPVLVMTGHGKDSPELAVQVMKCGAVDYVTKPFPETGETLDKRIIDALEKAAGSEKPPAADGVPTAEDRLAPFDDATRQLRIYLDEVKLCGITVWRERASSDIRDALLLLKEKPDGRYVHIEGSVLMKKLGRDPSNPVSRPFKDLCDKASQLMSMHRGLLCGRYDLIDSRGGYHLTDWIDVVVIDCNAADEDLGQATEPTDGTADGKVVANPLAKLEVELKGLAGKQVERLIHVCQTLKDGSTRSFEEIRRLSRVSRAQNMRDIAVLTERGLVEKDGRQKARVYRLSERATAILNPGS